MNPLAMLPMRYAATGNTQAAGNTGNSGDSSQNSDGLSVDNLGKTFLQLLITELKSQDPMSPMDGTQMVGQMVSLNQLDQLLAINKTLGTMAQNNSSGTSAAGGK